MGRLAPGAIMESKVLEALFPGARRIVLSALFADPDRWWSVEEVAGCAGVPPGSQQTYLVRLSKVGVLREQRAAGEARYQPDPACSIYAELRTIVAKLTQPPVCGET